MAAAASGFPALADGARLFPALAHRRLLDRSAPCALPTGPRLSRTKPWTDGRHHGWPVGQDERKGGVRGFDGHKRVKGRKRHILVDVLGLPLANRVEPANTSDPVAGARLLAGLATLWPTIRTVIADAGHKSRKLAGQLRRDGWQLRSLQAQAACFRDRWADMDRRAQLRVARFQSSLGEGLRAPGANLGDLDRHRRNPPDAEPHRAGMTFRHGLLHGRLLLLRGHRKRWEWYPSASWERESLPILPFQLLSAGEDSAG